MNKTALTTLVLAFIAPALSLADVTPVAPRPTCQVEVKEKKSSGDALTRHAAYQGLTYLSKASQQWTAQNNCFGCHVQAVTMEALATGKHHQYDVEPKDIEAMVKALKMGVTAGGRVTGVAFQGSAWARYDRWGGEQNTSELLRYAKELMGMQRQDGAIPDDDARLPVTGGTMQTTYQAAQTWRQAHARTADQRWLSPLRRAEGFLSSTAKGWKNQGRDVYLQDVNFALLGLVASGVTRSEESSLKLQRLLLERQNQDGGWGLNKGKSDAFATGQTVYALKLAGMSDADAPIARGMKYLVAQQATTGAWNTYQSAQGGSEKAETMWAVLGLVTVDIASIHVSGLLDGQHVTGALPLHAEAVDNKSGGIAQLSLKLDDLPVQTACGSKLDFVLDTKPLKQGKHLLDVIAVNAAGQESRRRFEVYTGNVFLTQVGANFDEQQQKSVISMRNIAEPSQKGTVEVEIWDLGKDGTPKAPVFKTSHKSEAGPVEVAWDGNSSAGKALTRGEYQAKLVFKDSEGKPLQTETTVFFHDSESVQREKFGEVEGKLSLGAADKGAGSANTLVQLVDEKGRVVQSVHTTEDGNYRFKNVDGGKYKVRAKKDGFADLESQEVRAAPSAASKAELKWQ